MGKHVTRLCGGVNPHYNIIGGVNMTPALDGVERLKKLRLICPDFNAACAQFKFRTFREEKPDMSVACSIFQATYGGLADSLLHELELWRSGSWYDMHNVCCYLIDFFSMSGEIECGAVVLRWMHDNCDICTPAAESEVLRL